jgi:hypothetical protein
VRADDELAEHPGIELFEKIVVAGRRAAKPPLEGHVGVTREAVERRVVLLREHAEVEAPSLEAR